MTNNRRRLGILVGGGPAPGINSAISAAAIEARNRGLDVVGIYDGYEHLVNGETDQVRELRIEDVSRIHVQGGSILRTSRANPTRSDDDLERTVRSLHLIGVDYLLTIGGDDTAFASFEVARRAEGSIRVAHVPKTIDNDLPLPAGMPTFGYETARQVGTDLVLTMMEDARTTNRWFIVVVMGRKAGHLALGIGKAAGATLTIIPEEFPGKHVSLDEVCAVIEGSVLKRRLNGRPDGLVVVAEGVGEKLDPDELSRMAGVEVAYDPYGHISLADIPLAHLLKQGVQKRFAERKDRISLVEVTLGYELRCSRPIPFDIDYTRTLGYGAVRFLTTDASDGRLGNGGFVCLEGSRLEVLPFDDLRDPVTGRTRVRLVDVNAEHYTVARDYMIRLERDDLEDQRQLQRLADVAKVTPQEFKRAFAGVLKTEERAHVTA